MSEDRYRPESGDSVASITAAGDKRHPVVLPTELLLSRYMVVNDNDAQMGEK